LDHESDDMDDDDDGLYEDMDFTKAKVGAS